MISQVLKSEIDAFASRMRSECSLLHKAQQGRLAPNAVLSYLGGVLYLIQRTMVHLELAKERSLERGQATLAAHFAYKFEEEEGHDAWAESDIRNLTKHCGDLLPTKPVASVVALAEYLESIIETDPQRYLAYMLFSEYFTVLLGPEWVAALQEHCGLPAETMTVISNHVELDKHHAAEALRRIDLIVSADQLQALQETLRRAMCFYEDFYDEISAQAA